MKKFLSTPLIVLSSLVSSSLLVADDNTDKSACEVKDITSFSYVENLQANSQLDVGALYKAKTEEVLAFGKKNHLKNFEIISQDASVSPNCCGSTGYQMNMSYTVSYEPSYEAFTAIQKFVRSASVSTYRVGMESCPANKR